jgi:hypothetical protein
MATVRSPAGTRIFVQSAAAADQALTGISKANPAVVSYSGVDPVNGDYIALKDMYGMTEFEDALVKVANVSGAGNTFEAEDQSSLLYGTFVSGNMTPITLATEINIATGFSFTGFDQQFAEYNLLKDKITRKFPTTVSAGGIEIPAIWDPNDSGSQTLMVAAETAQRLGFKVLFSDGLEMLFFGYIGASGLPKADTNNGIITTNISVTLATRPRYVMP